MKDTNKPQWLIDAENEIKKFEESKYGKMSSKNISRSLATSEINLDAIKNGKRNSFFKEGGKKQGSIQGKKNVESGLLDKIRDINAIKKAAKITGKKNVENGNWKKAQKAGQKIVQKVVKCPHCEKKGQLLTMKRWHFDNCKTLKGLA